LLVAHWSGHFMRRTLLPDVAWDGPALDVRVLSLATYRQLRAQRHGDGYEHALELSRIDRHRC
jgi:hypothetical protein